MAAPISKGRMIRKDISRSKGFAALSKDAQVLFCMMIPHLNSHGKMNGSPHFVKGEVCPLIKFLTVAVIGRCLKEINAKTSVKWFERDGLFWVHATHFKEHQNLDTNKLGTDEMPGFLLHDQSGTSSELVSHEDEVEVEGEVEVKGEGEEEGEGRRSGASHPLLDLWNTHAKASKGLVPAKELSRDRLEKCRLRIKDRPLDEWAKIFSRMAKTPFLNGVNDRRWRASFDWILANEGNAVKVLEGKYDDGKGGPNGASSESEYDRVRRSIGK